VQVASSILWSLKSLFSLWSIPFTLELISYFYSHLVYALLYEYNRLSGATVRSRSYILYWYCFLIPRNKPIPRRNPGPVSSAVYTNIHSKNRRPKKEHLAEPSAPPQVVKIPQFFVVGTPSLQVMIPGEPPNPLLGTQPLELLGIGGSP
jgi:hypothetical protein